MRWPDCLDAYCSLWLWYFLIILIYYFRSVYIIQSKFIVYMQQNQIVCFSIGPVQVCNVLFLQVNTKRGGWLVAVPYPKLSHKPL